MKKTAIAMVALLLCTCICGITAHGAESLIPVGHLVGLELSDGTVTVAAFDDTLGAKAKASGLCAGDVILTIDGKKVTCAEDVRRALACSRGTVTLRIERKGKEETLTLTPEITENGPKLGVFLKEGITGVGTVTFYDPETGMFGTLGHGVNNSKGEILKLLSGRAYHARVSSVCKGKAGKPGQLRGALCGTEPIGALTRNTHRGLFGKASGGWTGEAMQTAACCEIQPGPATILSTIEGDTVQQYSVEIMKIYPQTRSGDKNMLIRVTDPKLLETTGGIVQGMSGSPILQNGKIVGAVTHVLVNDPTRGYGIFIENMLDAAG